MELERVSPLFTALAEEIQREFGADLGAVAVKDVRIGVWDDMGDNMDKSWSVINS